jgi:hypothetical protein
MYHMNHWKQSGPEILAKAGELAAFTGNLQLLVQLLDWTLNSARRTAKDKEAEEQGEEEMNVAQGKRGTADARAVAALADRVVQSGYRFSVLVPLFQGALTGALTAKDLTVLCRTWELLRFVLGSTSELLSAPKGDAQLSQLDCRRLSTLSPTMIFDDEARCIWMGLLHGAKPVERAWPASLETKIASLLYEKRFESHPLLSIAVCSKWGRGSEWLIAEGVDVNGEVPREMSDWVKLNFELEGLLPPVIAAIRSGQHDMIRLLHSRGANIAESRDGLHKYHYSHTLPYSLEVAAGEIMDIQMVRSLVEEYGCHPDGVDGGKPPVEVLARFLKVRRGVPQDTVDKATSIYNYLLSRGAAPPSGRVDWDLDSYEDDYYDYAEWCGCHMCHPEWYGTHAMEEDECDSRASRLHERKANKKGWKSK